MDCENNAPGYNSIGRTGPTGSTGPTGTTGSTGPTGAMGTKGADSLALDYDFFLSTNSSVETETVEGTLSLIPQETQTTISYHFAPNDSAPHLLGIFDTQMANLSTTIVAPGLWDIYVFAVSNLLLNEILRR